VDPAASAIGLNRAKSKGNVRIVHRLLLNDVEA
jgi:hypothetical protein